MNKKKCPKCGEENPPEAVMCWACYTPLSGELNAPGAASNRAAAATGNSEEDKKKIPPWQLGIIGVALLGGIFVGVRTMMPASTTTDGEEEGTPPVAQTDDGPTGGMPSPSTPPPNMGSPTPSMTSGSSVPAPQAVPFTIVFPPSPRLSVATMAIVPTNSTSSGPQAAALAAYTRRQYKGDTKNWSSLYIFVFSDADSAKYFADYMKRRRGAPLTDSDYSYLSNLWGSVLTRYEYTTENGKRVEKALYPSKNPNSWWSKN